MAINLFLQSSSLTHEAGKKNTIGRLPKKLKTLTHKQQEPAKLQCIIINTDLCLYLIQINSL